MSKDPRTLSPYKTISDAGIAGLVGGAAAMWVFSYKNHDSHWRETGFLAGEAALNSLIITEGAKYSLRRERPVLRGGSGPFFSNGTLIGRGGGGGRGEISGGAASFKKKK